MNQPEPWLRGSWKEVPAVLRGVLHALELAEEDLTKWCGPLSNSELNAAPSGIPPVAFHLRHIGRSVDRLLTYAEGKALSEAQLGLLKTEMEPASSQAQLFSELKESFEKAASRVRALAAIELETPRSVGKKQLPTSVGGLLVHVADHTQRHVGQAITTAKIVTAGRG